MMHLKKLNYLGKHLDSSDKKLNYTSIIHYKYNLI